MSLLLTDIHRNRDKLFSLHRGGCVASYPGAKFVNGVAEPVKYRAACRLKAALGSDLTVTLYEPPKPAKVEAPPKPRPQFHPAAKKAQEAHAAKRRAKVRPEPADPGD